MIRNGMAYGRWPDIRRQQIVRELARIAWDTLIQGKQTDIAIVTENSVQRA